MQQNVKAPKDIADKVVEHLAKTCGPTLSSNRTTLDVQKNGNLDKNCVCPTSKKLMLTVNTGFGKTAMVQTYYYCQL